MKLDQQNRPPKVDYLPDGRQLVTRFYDVLEYLPKDQARFGADVELAYATADAVYTNCRLVKQGMADPSLKPSTDRHLYIRVYEELDASAETQVGQATKIRLEDGRDAWVYTYRQFTTGTHTPGTIGSSTAPGNGSLFLQKVEAPDDGVVRTITRTYVDDGLLDQQDSVKNDGKLLLRTLVYAKTVPPTPGGYILTDTSVKNVNGFPVYTYGFAQGNGEISRRTSSENNDKLQRVVITHLTASSVGTQPTSDPLAGGIAIVTGKSDQDGYSVWEVTWVKGSGEISRRVAQKNNAKLIITVIRHLTASSVGSQPTSNPGSATLFDTDKSDQDGYSVWTVSWAAGSGEIDRSLDYSQSSDQGTTGITKLTIVHLTASSVGTDPTSAAGYAKVRERRSDQDGYRLWTVTYAKGAGLVLDEVNIRSMGALIIYHRVALGTAPTAPTATIGGTVTLFDSGTRQDEGYTVHDYRWAEGNGQTGVSAQGRADGSRVYVVTELDAAPMTPAYPGGGTSYLVDLDQTVQEAYWVNRATYIRLPDTTTFKRQISFTMPGLASFSGNQLTVSPPTQRTLLADDEVSYSTSQITNPPFSVTAGASYNESFIRTGSAVGESKVRSLGYVLAMASSVSGIDANFNGVLCDAYSGVLISSIPSSRPTGVTVLRVENDLYLTALDGTLVFRRSKISYPF